MDVVHGRRVEARGQLRCIQSAEVGGLKVGERLGGQVASEQMDPDIALVVGDGPWLDAGGAEARDPIHQIPTKG